MQHEVVQEERFDTNIGFIKDPYRFLSKKLDRYHTDALANNLLFIRPTVILRGEEGARLFYDKDKFTRENVMPQRIQNPLFGRGTIHGQDLDRHEERKAFFLSLLGPDQIFAFFPLFEEKWMHYLKSWQQRESIVLLDEASQVICEAICNWVGLKLGDKQIKSFAKNAV